MMTHFKIDGQKIGLNSPCFIIAEAGVNHNGDLEMAKKLVEVAARCGANAVKFQTFQAEKLATPDAPKADYQQRSTADTESQFEMLKKLELSLEDHKILIQHCGDHQITFMASPFDEASVDLLNDLNVPAFKVPSGELTNSPLLSYIASKQKPIVVSTGMANLGEVEQAVNIIEQTGNTNIALLHCVSNYPANPKDIHLRAMQTMKHAFALPIGYSDHTLGNEVAFAAVALGACVIEKHFTLDRTMPGPDHQASCEPDQLTELVQGIRNIEKSLGSARKQPAASELNTMKVARKSLVAAQPIAAGMELSEELIAIKRPGTGLPPTLRSFLIGQKVNQDIEAGTLFSLEMLQ